MDVGLEERLERLGLSEKEIDTYLAILEHGSAKASTIAADAGVSKRYVYSIAERLERRGFVEVDDHVRPTMIRARPPEDVLTALNNDIQELEPGLSARYSRTEQDLEPIEVIKSRRTVIKRIRTVVEAAEEEIHLSAPLSVLTEVEDSLREATERGVLVLLLVTGEEHVDDDLVEVASVVRQWEERTPLLLVADMVSSLIAPYHMVVGAGANAQAITLTQQQLSPIIMGSFFGNYWPVASEVGHADPLELPHTFSCFRHAVLQAALYQQAGERLLSRAEVRVVGADGDFETVDGEVVDVRQSMIEPPTNAFPVENSLVLETDDGRVSVGGDAAFVEELECRSIELFRPEE